MYKHHLHRSNANLSDFEKYVLRWLESFSSSPCGLTVLKNDNTKFKATLREYLNINSFYTVDELLK